MNQQIQDLVDRIHQLEERLESEFQKSREAYQVKIRGKIAEFAEEIVVRHRAMRMRMPQYFRTAGLLNVLVAPVIYSMLIPIALIDFWVTVYQQVCFRAYGIPLVKRSTYILLDRHHLAYLNAIEKINCLYCGYGNGVFSYAREVASRTEQFWCPIKHAMRVRDPHARYVKFLEFGDAEGYLCGLDDLRKDVQSSGDT